MAKRNRAPRSRRVVEPRTILLLRPVLRWSNGRGAFVLRLVSNSFGPVLVRNGDGAQGTPPSSWQTPPIPLEDYAEDDAAREDTADEVATEPPASPDVPVSETEHA